MLKIGCHLSCAKGFLAMGKEAVKIGANTFQFFTRNPRGGKAKPLDLEDVAAYRAFAQEQGLFPILAHAPYTLNACAADEGLRTFARETMADDLARLEVRKEGGIIACTVLEEPSNQWRFVEVTEDTFHWQNVTKQAEGLQVNCEVFARRIQ